MCRISDGIDTELEDGTKRQNLQNWLKGEIGCKSEAVKTYSTGPKAEPGIILALIGSVGETASRRMV